MIGVKDREWAIDLRVKKNPQKTKQIKDWKNIHAEPMTVEKIWKIKQKKKRKEEPENVVGKRKKMKKKENKRQFEHFYFQWLLSLGLMHFFCSIVLSKLYCWKFFWSWGRAAH